MELRNNTFSPEAWPAAALPEPGQPEVHRARQQLADAISLLQQAAFLANYHQPSLARQIRAFLTDAAES